MKKIILVLTIGLIALSSCKKKVYNHYLQVTNVGSESVSISSASVKLYSNAEDWMSETNVQYTFTSDNMGVVELLESELPSGTYYPMVSTDEGSNWGLYGSLDPEPIHIDWVHKKGATDISLRIRKSWYQHLDVTWNLDDVVLDGSSVWFFLDECQKDTEVMLYKEGYLVGQGCSTPEPDTGAIVNYWPDEVVTLSGTSEDCYVIGNYVFEGETVPLYINESETRLIGEVEFLGQVATIFFKK